MRNRIYFTLIFILCTITLSYSQLIDASNFSKTILGKDTTDSWFEILPDIWVTGLNYKPLYVLDNEEYLDENYSGLAYPDTSWYYNNDSLYVFYAGNQDSVSVIRKTGGWSTTSGDFNGDSMQDIVTITSMPDSCCFIFYGNNQFSAYPDYIMKVDERISGVASAGDVNGDGYDDLLLAMQWGVNEVYLYFGSDSGIDSSSYIVLSNSHYGFGHLLSKHSGDINNDGYDDILIGGRDSAYFCLYYGNSAGSFMNADHRIEFPAARVGYNSLSFIGDVNNDDFDDLAVPLGYSGADSISRVQVYYGSSSGLDTNYSQLLEIYTGEYRAPFNQLRVSKANDINHDGIDDMILGDQYKNGIFGSEGAVYVFYGALDSLQNTPDKFISNPIPENNVRFGNELDGVGDINNDGIDDIVVGSPYANKAFIFYGSSTGISDTSLTVLSNQNNNEFGWAVSAVGNVFGDGRNFFIAGEEFGTSFLYVYKDLINRVPVNRKVPQYITVYPNPSADFITIDYNEELIKEVVILSSEGRTVIKQKSSRMINLGDLSSGLYFIQITTVSNGKLTGKLLKK